MQHNLGPGKSLGGSVIYGEIIGLLTRGGEGEGSREGGREREARGLVAERGEREVV